MHVNLRQLLAGIQPPVQRGQPGEREEEFYRCIPGRLPSVVRD
jgi:hypothetical protein